MTEQARPMDNQPQTATKNDIIKRVKKPENIAESVYGRKCGDDRDQENDGRLSRFGGDAGYALGLLAVNKEFDLGLSVRDIVDSVVEASVQDGTKFTFHTDEDEGPEPHAIGCGHLARATKPENQEGYGVNPDDVKEMIEYIKELAQTQPDRVEIQTLSGKHDAKAVIQNMGKMKNIRHSDGEDKVFAVDVKRDQDYVNNKLFPLLLDLIPELGPSNVDADTFQKILDKQTATTAHLLAEGLPVFDVNIDEAIPVIISAGTVQ